MSRVKTREKGKNIKVLDRSSLVGQRMKNALIRSKRSAAELMDNRQATPSEYAEDKVQLAADDLIHDTANVAASGTKAAVRQGRKLFQRQREKKAAEKRRETTMPTEQLPSPGASPSVAPEGQPTPAQANRSGLRRERRRSGMSELCPTGRSEGYGACNAEERGRNFAKKQAAKAPRQVGSAIKTMETPMKTAKRPAQAMGQTAKVTGRGTKDAIKNAQRTVKTAQRTSKTAIKTADHTARAAQKTAQATAKAAKVTAQAARATAKTTAAATKATARGASATVKAIIASSKTLVAVIAAGGWVAILVIVIICLIGLIVGSYFGIFFSGEDSGTGQTMPAVVREINQEYEGKLEEIKNSNAHDVLEMAGSRAVWPEVLAIYAIKTTTDPDDPQEVATMDDSKKDLLKEIFGAMNEISYRTETTVSVK